MAVSWQDIDKDIRAAQPSGKNENGLDIVRRKYYKDLVEITKRPLLVYASAFHFLPKAAVLGNLLSIDLSDKDGFVEILQNLRGKKLDIFIHSPGGSAEAAESIVDIIRKDFDDVRFIVTGTAKSAATMLAMSGNKLLMNEAGELGPIDPQVRIDGRFCPAGSIIEEFDKAVKDIKSNPSNFNAWIPILKQYGPSLLIECENYIKLSKTLVRNWLTGYMFKGKPNATKLALKASKFLANEKKSLSHARRIDIDQLLKLGIGVIRLEDEDSKLQDAIRRVHLAIMMSVERTGAYKIFENSEGSALIRQAKMELIPPQTG